MRRDFVAQVLIEMERDSSIVFLTADLGFNALEKIKERFPGRFLNVGIAEQHMIGMASGLALEGEKVIAYSIASFVTMRPYEQIRNDVCYQNLDVKIVGTGGGYNYANHGVSHHTVEDVAIMNVLPHMEVLCPGYSWEAREATKTMLHHKGPVYLRLGKSPGIAYEKKQFTFELGKGFSVREGSDIVLVSTGNVLDIAQATAELIEQKYKLSVCVLSMPCLKPFDEKLLLKYAQKAKGVFTIEEHSTTGGLGSIASAILFADGFNGKNFHAFGFPPESFLKDVGDRNYLLAKVGLEPHKLASSIMRLL
jgi:transketolase